MIRVLPTEIANKIAAGEVVERPASVVKELVENALDADATRIVVELAEGGKRLIRVTDDGCGMSAEDLPLAFAPHATSKILGVEDLFEIVSYGFRGEALASIGSVARAQIVTRKKGEVLGHKVSVERSVVSDVVEAGGPEGTIVEVRDLFYNTPARRKFLKSDGAEVARVSEVLTRVALSRPDVDIRFEHDERKVMALTGTDNLETRVLSLFGNELKGKLLPVSSRVEGIEVTGFIGLPETAKGRAGRQYLFLNDRFIKDRSVNHAVTQGFHGFLMPRRYPIYFLRLTVDPKTVDVNVHPMKAEVRFRDRNAVFGLVQRAVRHVLEGERPAGSLEMGKGQGANGTLSAGAVGGAPANVAAGEYRPTVRQRVEEMEQTLFPSSGDRISEGAPATGPGQPPTPNSTIGTPAPTRKKGTSGCRYTPEPRPMSGPGDYRFLQIHSSYIVVEDDDGFYVIDQHALHERMLYERLQDRVARGEVMGQKLLVPEVVELSPSEYGEIISRTEELAELGLVVAPFGGNAIAVEEVPLELASGDPRRMIDAVLKAGDEDVQQEFRGLRNQVLASMACRAAVKFNERLSDDQIRGLLDWERTSVDSAACPHGRPTRMRITMQELELQFLRKV